MRTLILPFCALSLATTAVARDGDFDETFGFYHGGKSEFTYAGPKYVNSVRIPVAVQSTGKIIVGGSAGANLDFGAMRLMPDGSVDTTFGASSNGGVTVPFDRSGGGMVDTLWNMVVQPDDSILLVGEVDGDSSTGVDIGVVKLTADGHLDNVFGGGTGKTVVQFNLGGNLTDVGTSIGVQSDHKILLGGNVATGAATSQMAVARLLATGQRDSSFSLDGRVAIGFGGDSALAFRVRELADGAHILVAGTASITPGSTKGLFAMARINVSDGSLDNNFGSGGKATYDFAVATGGGSTAYDFVELPDGRLMLCGNVQVNLPDNYDFACMRFLANGSPDPAFTPAVFPFDIGDDFYDIAGGVARDPQGRFVLAGYAHRATNNSDCAVARLTPDGQLDQSFGNGGELAINSIYFIGIDADNTCTDLVLQPDGKIVIGGVFDSGSGNQKFEVIRLMGDTIFADGFDP